MEGLISAGPTPSSSYTGRVLATRFPMSGPGGALENMAKTVPFKYHYKKTFFKLN